MVFVGIVDYVIGVVYLFFGRGKVELRLVWFGVVVVGGLCSVCLFLICCWLIVLEGEV